MGICVDMMSGKYDSAEEIYEKRIKRLTRPTGEVNEEAVSHLRYDKESDMMICDEKNESTIGFITVLNNIGFGVDIFTYDMNSTVDDLIDFYKHLKF